MDLKTTHFEIAERIATITLSRPKRRNAWTGRMHTEYRWLLDEANRDPGVRVIVVTGDPEGGAFCAGADLGALEGMPTRGATIRGRRRTSPPPAMASIPASMRASPTT